MYMTLTISKSRKFIEILRTWEKMETRLPTELTLESSPEDCRQAPQLVLGHVQCGAISPAKISRHITAENVKVNLLGFFHCDPNLSCRTRGVEIHIEVERLALWMCQGLIRVNVFVS